MFTLSRNEKVKIKFYLLEIREKIRFCKFLSLIYEIICGIKWKVRKKVEGRK